MCVCVCVYVCVCVCSSTVEQRLEGFSHKLHRHFMKPSEPSESPASHPSAQGPADPCPGTGDAVIVSVGPSHEPPATNGTDHGAKV